MSDRLVELVFSSQFQAVLARNILVAEGIRVQITQDVSTWAMSGMFDNVKLVVHESDAERAGQLLDEVLQNPLEGVDESPTLHAAEPTRDFAENQEHSSPKPGEAVWKCPTCAVSVAASEPRCWSCGTSASGEINPYFVGSRSTLSPAVGGQRSHGEVPEEVHDIVDRAWRAATLGFALLPFAHLYSVWLLLTIADQASHLAGSARRRFYSALCLDVLVVVVLVVLVVSVISK